MENTEYNTRKALISKAVSEILLEQDCVILPGFGGFVASYAAVQKHPVTHVFQPPSKHLLFNAQLKTDDGFLVQRLMPLQDMDYSSCRQWLTEFTELMAQRILAGERTELQHIGTFTLDPERAIRFQQDYSVNFLGQSFGRYAVQAAPVLRVTVDPVLEKEPAVVPLYPEKKFKSKRVIGLLAAASVVIAAALLLPQTLGTGTFSMGFDSWTHNTTPTALMYQTTTPMPLVRKSVLPEPSNAFNVEEAKIFLVAGCFSTRLNADGMVAYLQEKGFDAQVLDQTPAGLHRVVYGSYASVSEASAELAQIKKGLNEEAWLLVR
ncbi:MAG: SPOR domain-containing protein [Bacteroidia bacterium]